MLLQSRPSFSFNYRESQIRLVSHLKMGGVNSCFHILTFSNQMRRLQQLSPPSINICWLPLQLAPSGTSIRVWYREKPLFNNKVVKLLKAIVKPSHKNVMVGPCRCPDLCSSKPSRRRSNFVFPTQHPCLTQHRAANPEFSLIQPVQFLPCATLETASLAHLCITFKLNRNLVGLSSWLYLMFLHLYVWWFPGRWSRSLNAIFRVAGIHSFVLLSDAAWIF